MPVFSNLYKATVDDKGRIVLPSAYKKELVGEMDKVFTIEFDPSEKCLNLYPSSSWEKRLSYVKSRLNPNDPRQSKVLDRFYQSFVKIEMSDNGRLNIPNPYLDKCGIVKEAVFTGQGERIRLWDAEEYNQSMLSDADYKADFEAFMGGPLTGY